MPEAGTGDVKVHTDGAVWTPSVRHNQTMGVTGRRQGVMGQRCWSCPSYIRNTVFVRSSFLLPPSTLLLGSQRLSVHVIHLPVISLASLSSESFLIDLRHETCRQLSVISCFSEEFCQQSFGKERVNRERPLFFVPVCKLWAQRVSMWEAWRYSQQPSVDKHCPIHNLQQGFSQPTWPSLWQADASCSLWYRLAGSCHELFKEKLYAIGVAKSYRQHGLNHNLLCHSSRKWKFKIRMLEGQCW